MIALTGEEKASLLLLCLDPEVTERALAQLSKEEKARVKAQMQRFAASPQRQALVAQVMAEIERMVEQPALRIAETPEPGPPTLRLAVPPGNAKFAEPGSARGRKPDPEPVDEAEDTVALLNQTGADRLVLALEGENPRTVALIINLLGSELAAKVFKQLPSEVRCAASVCMTTSAIPGPEVLQRVARALVVKERTLPRTVDASKAEVRFKKTAELLRQLERAERTAAMEALEQRDANAATQVRQWLYRFDDLLALDGRSVQKVLAEIDAKTLAVAMKTAPEDIKQKVFDNLSKRARDGLTEEMGFLAAVAPSQVQQAQKAVVEVIQRMDQAGGLVMLR
jgi:flagellar motor switch protein FliG